MIGRVCWFVCSFVVDCHSYFLFSESKKIRFSWNLAQTFIVDLHKFHCKLFRGRSHTLLNVLFIFLVPRDGEIKMVIKYQYSIYPKQRCNSLAKDIGCHVFHVVVCTGFDACQSTTCQNGGTCQTDDINLYTCSCLEQFTGRNCELGMTSRIIFSCSHSNILVVGFIVSKKKLKMCTVYFMGLPSHSYGTSPAMWDHTVLPVTRHKWTRPALTPASKLLLDLPTPEGWKTELT